MRLSRSLLAFFATMGATLLFFALNTEGTAIKVLFIYMGVALLAICAGVIMFGKSSPDTMAPTDDKEIPPFQDDPSHCPQRGKPFTETPRTDLTFIGSSAVGLDGSPGTPIGTCKDCGGKWKGKVVHP